jgi:HEAT repeat protein
LVAFVCGVSRIFLVVYAREVFGQSDGMISLFTVFGGLGTLIVMLLVKFLVDQIGAKPILSVCTIIGLVSMVPVIFFPGSLSDNFTTVTLFLSFLFFMMNFGWLGADGIMQTYFIGLVPPEKVLDMGILFFFCYGIAGAGGSFLSGLLLDAVKIISGSELIAFKVFYAVLIAVSVAALFLIRKLTPMGALPFKDALEVMFSYRDLKAISLLERLNKTSDSEEEEAILGALHDAPSNLAVKGLLARTKSPRLSVRMESIRAIDALPVLNEEAEKALMDDIVLNPYTSAYRSARALGNHGVFPAVPLLRELAVSSDYMLAGEAIISLAKLRDDAFRPEIERIVTETENPRLKMAGVEAIGIYGYPDSLPLLLGILRKADPPPYFRDELALAIASILDIQNKFYPLLIRFLSDESMAPALAQDEAETAYEHFMAVHGRKLGARSRKKIELYILEQHAKAFYDAVTDYMQNKQGDHLGRWISELPEHLVHERVQRILSEVVLDDEFINHRRLRLLIVSWCAHELRLWTNKLKES